LAADDGFSDFVGITAGSFCGSETGFASGEMISEVLRLVNARFDGFDSGTRDAGNSMVLLFMRASMPELMGQRLSNPRFCFREAMTP
jgi:hypothetical protein